MSKKEKKIKSYRPTKNKNGEYLITYTRHLEKRLRSLETEKQLLDAERVRLEQEVHSLRNQVDTARNARLRKTPIISNNSRNHFSGILGKENKKQKESQTDSPAKFETPIGENADKLQESREKRLKWYELHSVKADQPSISNNKIEKERKKTSDPVFKIIVLGKPEKTAFIRMFITGIFEEDLKNTLGADFSLKNVEVEGKKVTLRIWDFAAEERFRTLLPSYITGSNGVIIMQDIIDAKTLKAISEVIELVKQDVGNIPIFLNVPELPSKAEEFADFSKKYTLTEISSEIGLKGEQVFELLTEKMLEYERIE